MKKIKGLSLLYTPDDIDGAVQRLSYEISEEYRERKPLLIGVLKGSFIFCADLVRTLDFPMEIDFVRAASYGMVGVSSSGVRLLKDVEQPVDGRDLIIIEDIVDTGLTLKYLYDHLMAKRPASIKICALIDKRERRAVDVKLDFIGFTIEKGFLVGYGLDYKEMYRYLRSIYILKEEL